MASTPVWVRSVGMVMLRSCGSDQQEDRTQDQCRTHGAIGVSPGSRYLHMRGDASACKRPQQQARGWNQQEQWGQGAELGRRVLAQLQDISAATEAIREARPRFSVTVATAPSFAMRWLLPRMPALKRAHPRIELSVLVNQGLDTISDGLDLAIRMGAGPWPGVHSEPMMDDSLYPVVSPTYLEATGCTDDIACLCSLRLLHDRDPATSWERWRREHGPANLSLGSGPRLASSDLVLRAAELGQGVALARGRLAADSMASGALVRPFRDLEIRLPDAYWIVRPGEPSSKAPGRHALDLVVRWLKDQAAQEAG